jgi:hypothetical protein
MVRFVLYILIPITVCISLFSCEKIIPKIKEPAYIEIPNYSIAYKTSYSNGGPGTKNHKFTDVKVTLKGKDYGIYPLPAKIPVLETGECNLTIAPVIKVNGVSTVRSEYAPIKLFDSTIVISEGKTHTITPVFDYYANGITFYWVEDFEVSGSSLIGDTAIKLQSIEKFEGTKAVKIELKNGQNSCMAYSSSSLPLPNNSEMLYLEVNYKCNQKFEVGLLDANKQFLGSAGGANPSAEWNKIYFFLTPVASRNQRSSYLVYFYFDKNDFADNGLGANPVLYIDNIKVVSQP